MARRFGRSVGRLGVTLLELIVVLSLMGLILAIAAPAFIMPRQSAEPEVTTALETARHAAIVRGEPVTLSIGDAGAWRIVGDATPAASPIATGALSVPIGRLRVRVSPLGTCIGDARAAVVWDALACRVEATTARESAK